MAQDFDKWLESDGGVNPGDGGGTATVSEPSGTDFDTWLSEPGQAQPGASTVPSSQDFDAWLASPSPGESSQMQTGQASPEEPDFDTWLGLPADQPLAKSPQARALQAKLEAEKPLSQTGVVPKTKKTFAHPLMQPVHAVTAGLQGTPAAAGAALHMVGQEYDNPQFYADIMKGLGKVFKVGAMPDPFVLPRKALEIAADKLPPRERKKNILTFAGQAAYEYWTQMQEEQRARLSTNTSDVEWRNPQWWVNSVFDAGGSMAGAIALGGGNPAASAVVGSIMEAGPFYEDLEKNKDAHAGAKALAFGVVVAALEKIGFDQFFKQMPKGIMKKVVARVMGGIAESTGEMAENPVQKFIEVCNDEGLTWTEKGKQVIQAAKDGWGVGLPTFVLGVLGAGSGGAEASPSSQPPAQPPPIPQQPESPVTPPQEPQVSTPPPVPVTTPEGQPADAVGPESSQQEGITDEEAKTGDQPGTQEVRGAEDTEGVTISHGQRPAKERATGKAEPKSAEAKLKAKEQARAEFTRRAQKVNEPLSIFRQMMVAGERLGAKAKGFRGMKAIGGRIKRPNKGDPQYEEIISSIPSQYLHKDGVMKWDEYIPIAQEMGLLEADQTGVEDLAKLLQGPLKTVGQAEAEEDAYYESQMHRAMHSSFLEDMQNGVRPPAEVIEEFPDDYKRAIKDAKERNPDFDEDALVEKEELDDEFDPDEFYEYDVPYGDEAATFDPSEFDDDAAPTVGVDAAAATSTGEFEFMPKGTVEAVNITGVRKSVQAIERRMLGMPEEVKAKARKFPELISRALDTLDSDRTAGIRLVDELKDQPRPLDDLDIGLLTVEKGMRVQEANDAASETVRVEKSGTQAEKDAAGKRFVAARKALEEIMDVLAIGENKSKTLTARGLSAMRLMIDEEFNLVALEQAMKDSQGGKELSDAQKYRARWIEEGYNRAKTELAEHEKRVAAKEKEAEQMMVDAQANVELNDIIQEILDKHTLAKKTTTKMLELGARYKQEALAELRHTGGRMSMGVDPMPLVAVVKYGVGEVIELSAKGTIKFQEWLGNMRKAFPFLGGMSDAELKKLYLQSIRDAETLASEMGEDAEPGAAKPKRKGKKGSVDTQQLLGDIAETAKDGGTVYSDDIKALFRAEVEAGIVELEAITENVRKKLEAVGVKMTPIQIKIAFSDYGVQSKKSRPRAAKVLAYLRRQSQLDASIDRVARGLAPLKTGRPREPDNPVTREKKRRLHKMMKEANIPIGDPAKQLASALATKKRRLRNSIEDMEMAMATGKAITRANGIGPTDAEIKDLERRRDAMKKEYDAIFGTKELTDEQRLAAAIKSAERSLKQQNEILHDARMGIFDRAQKEKRTPVENELLRALRAERDATKAEVKRLRDIAFPPLTPEQKAIRAVKLRRKAATAKIKQQIRENNFTVKPRVVVDISGDPEAVQAQMEYEAAKKQKKIAMEEARKAARSLPEAIVEEIGMARKIAMTGVRAILTSFDDSALGRQGWVLLQTHPFIWGSGIPKMLKAGFSRVESKRQNEAIHNRPNAKNGIYDKAKLPVPRVDENGNFVELDDEHMGDVVNRIPNVAFSSRKYGTFLTWARCELFDMFLRTSSDPKGTDVKKLKEIADLVMSMTGTSRGTLTSAEASRWLFAPAWLKATAKMATGYHLWTLTSASAESRARAAKEYARMLASISFIYLIYNLFKRKDAPPIEKDIRSKDWGTIFLGPYKFNPLGAAQPVLVLLAQLISGQAKTPEGMVNLRTKGLWLATEKEKQMKESHYKNIEKLVLQAFKQKRSPQVGYLWTLFTGKQFSGEEATVAQVVLDSVVPIAAREEAEAFGIVDWPAAVAVSIAVDMGLPLRPDWRHPRVEKMQYKKKARKVLKADDAADVKKAMDRAIRNFYEQNDKGNIVQSRSQKEQKARAFAEVLRKLADEKSENANKSDKQRIKRNYEAAITELSRKYRVSASVIDPARAKQVERSNRK